MATAAKATTYPHIVKTPGVRAGKARIDGTRICVTDIARLVKQGYRPEEMLDYFSSRPLTLGEVHSAIAYYYDNPDEIEAYFEGEEKVESEIEAIQAEYLSRKAGQ